MLLLLLACTDPDPVDSDSSAPGCEEVRTLKDGTTVQVLGEGASVVFLKGAFTAEQVPTDLNPDGYRLITVNLQTDRFGPESRRALASALRHAGGEPDAAGCAIPPGPVFIGALSNGGNLAVSTLADPALDLPEIAGLVTWETPIGPQLILIETDNPETGACSMDGTLVCAFDGSALAANAQDTWLDRDSDGIVDPNEPVLLGIGVGDQRMHSPQVAVQLGPNDWTLSAEASTVWFAWRDAGRRARDAAQRHPEMAVLVIGSTDDHVQTLPGSPHVYALAQEFTAAGNWVRLNPDADVTGFPTDNPGGGGSGELLDGAKSGVVLVNAGLTELILRVETNHWGPQL